MLQTRSMLVRHNSSLKISTANKNFEVSVCSLPFVFLQVFILEELLSPVVTPIILIFCLRRKSLEIIDFFRNFTVEVIGVGDTCSFAQMDIRQHGHPAVRDCHRAAKLTTYVDTNSKVFLAYIRLIDN